MNKTFIVKTAISTGLSDNMEDNWQKLLTGETAIDKIEHFNTARLEYHKAACSKQLWTNGNTNHVCELVQHTIEQIKPVPEGTYIIWTGIKGNAEYIEADQNIDTPYLPFHYRKWVAEELGIKNYGLEINAACASSAVGLAIGAQKIAQGECNSVLVIAADVVTRFVHTGFSALKALTANECRPFDKNRDGLCIGDGAVSILLMNEETANSDQFEKLACLSGWGIANDANHITGPARDGSGLILAIKNALKMANINSADIEAFCAHGTGTAYNDGMELVAIENLFGERIFPIFSIKGAIGHTLGAAGGIEAAVSTLALREKIVPPTAGFLEPEEETINRIMNTSQKFDGNNILTTNSGFGGVNAAIILVNE